MSESDEDADLERRVAELEQQLDAVCKQLGWLRDEVESSSMPGDVDVVGGFTGREARVLAVIADEYTPGDRITRSEIDSIYKRVTNLRRKKTIRERVKDLTRDGPFKHVTAGVWTYTGGEDA